VTALWRRLLDIGADPADDADLAVRKRTAMGTLLALVATGFVYVIIGLATDRPLVIVFAVFQMSAQVVNLVYFSRSKRLEPVVWTLIAVGLIVIFSGIVTLGGLNGSAGNVVWGIIAPLGAILLVSGRAGLPVYVGLVAVVLLGIVLDPIIPKDQAIPHGQAVVAMAVNVLGAALVSLGLVRYIDGQRLAARRESDALLRNVLPESIADRLKHGERVIADHFDEASILFADVVDFTPFAEARSPQETVAVLNDLFTEFDRLADQFGLEKIKTIGDAYMVVAGVPEHRDDHAGVLVEMALAMHRHVEQHAAVFGRRLQIRTGIASGPVVAGVIGQRKFAYDLWGDTVNTAARMESSGLPDRIQVTDATCRLLAGHYPFQRRDGVEIKGKGVMTTWTLDPATMRSSSGSLDGRAALPFGQNGGSAPIGPPPTAMEGQ
jgi:adenylate cyclase